MALALGVQEAVDKLREMKEGVWQEATLAVVPAAAVAAVGEVRPVVARMGTIMEVWLVEGMVVELVAVELVAVAKALEEMVLVGAEVTGRAQQVARATAKVVEMERVVREVSVPVAIQEVGVRARVGPG